MRVHVDEGRPDVVRFEINGGGVGGCRRACRFDRSDPLIVDEEVDKCRVVAINSGFRPAGQEADRNASLPDPIALRFWHLERFEQVHRTRCSPSRGRWRSYNPAPKSIDQQMLATEGLTGTPPFDESAN
jgi:hypothetical protein